jgi:hypothetical protein
MADVLGGERRAVVCRELTKTHEEVRRGSLADLAAWAADGVRGEVTVVLAGAAEAPELAADDLPAAVAVREQAGLSARTPSPPSRRSPAAPAARSTTPSSPPSSSPSPSSRRAMTTRQDRRGARNERQVPRVVIARRRSRWTERTVRPSLGSPHVPPRPHRGRLALRQRPPPHRPRRRLRRAVRRVQPLPADAGRPGAHGQRHRRARHADPGAGRPRGRHRPRAGRPLQPGDRRGPAGPRPVVRPVHPHHDAQPLRRRADAVHGAARQRLRRRALAAVGDRPDDRARPAGPLRRGHLPDLRLRRRARRPVRQLRQPARPAGPQGPAVEDRRQAAAVRESAQFFLELPAFAEALGGWLQTRRAGGRTS